MERKEINIIVDPVSLKTLSVNGTPLVEYMRHSECMTTRLGILLYEWGWSAHIVNTLSMEEMFPSDCPRWNGRQGCEDLPGFCGCWGFDPTAYLEDEDPEICGYEESA